MPKLPAVATVFFLFLHTFLGVMCEKVPSKRHGWVPVLGYGVLLDNSFPMKHG